MDENTITQKDESNSSGRLSGSHEIHSSQPTKRALPRSHNLIEHVGASEIRQRYGKSSRLNPCDESRPLPSPFLHEKHSSTIQFVGLRDSFHQTGLGEERPIGTDKSFVFQAAVQDLNQPKREANLPDGILSVSLLRHQKIALSWMLSKESSNLCSGGILADDQGLGKTVSMIALILMQKGMEAKSKSKESSTTNAEAFNLEDDDADQIKGSEDFTMLPQPSEGFRSKRLIAGTLIVCLDSVVRQWARELDDKVTDKAKISVLIYHGGNRTKDPTTLAKYDVVLTTYAIVTNEVPCQPSVEENGERYGVFTAFSAENHWKQSLVNKGKKDIDMTDLDSSPGALSRVKWSTVILDDCHIIQNHRTQVARACCSLRAKRRWCLSGTPLQDSIDELFSYFRFLRYDPYDKYKTFCSSIMAFIGSDSVRGYGKLQVVLKNIMLRRTKCILLDGKPIVDLPPKKVHLTRVEFSSEERAFYEKLEFDSCKQLKAYAAAGTIDENYGNIMLMLLRLREACDHPLLVKLLSSDPVGKASYEMVKMLPLGVIHNLWKQLETTLCLVCSGPPENAVVTICGHVFCYECVSDHLTGEHNTCPAAQCKEQLGAAAAVYSRYTLSRFLCGAKDDDSPFSYYVSSKIKSILENYEPREDSVVVQSDYVSSKIKSTIEILKAHCISKSDGDASSSSASFEREKAIVFSQWTNMLDLVEMSLKNCAISYRRLDCTMSLAARENAIEDFNTDPEVDVMLMSLKAENLGLNMVAASRVILLDLCWNSTTEDQAADRAHRIGQTRTVTVSRLTVKDTIEDRILALQEDKRKMVASAFGEDSGAHGANKLSMEDLSFLFEGPAFLS